MTLDALAGSRHVTGIKQVCKAVANGIASCVFVAADADSRLTDPLRALCIEHNVEVVDVAEMAEIGKSCSIDVGSAAAAIIRR